MTQRIIGHRKGERTIIDVLKKVATRKLREVFAPALVHWLQTVQAYCWTLKDISEPQCVKKLVLLIMKQEHALIPYRWQYSEERSYPLTKENIDLAIQKWIQDAAKEPDGRLGVYLKGTMPYEVSYLLELNHTSELPFCSMDIRLNDSYFRSRERVESFIEFLTEIYFFFSAEYLAVFHTDDLEKKYLKHPKKVEDGGNIPTFWMKPAHHMPAIGWLTILGPRYAQLIDPRVADVSAYVKRMDDGGIMLLTSPSPLRYGEKDTVRCEEELKKVLPKDLFFKPLNPAGPYLSPDYPLACKEWIHRDEFERTVEIHLKTSGSIISNIRLLHRPSGISVSKDVEGQDINVLERELMVDLRRRVDDAGTLK